MKLSISDLKNLIIVAKGTGKMQSIEASKTNDYQDISILVCYYPIEDKQQDIYPYFEIKMKEEESSKNIFLDGKDLAEVRNTYNGFLNQGIGESFIENDIIPY